MENYVDLALERLGLEAKLLEEVLAVGRLKKVAADQVVVGPGSMAREMPIVLKGLLKVMRQDDNGNEVFLYYLEGGQACAMSITCCIEGKISQFKVTAEEPSDLWMVPLDYIDAWVQKYRTFRLYVFTAYQARFDELLNAIDSISFLKLDERLYKYLLDHKQATGSFVINKTHEQIARELNTSRVVVSRLLKQLERQDKIEQHRNRIEVL